jgi:hypothetical protein
LAITDKQFWMLVHLGLGALYLHGFGTGLVGLGHQGQRFGLAILGAVLLAIGAWASVITGTWIVYPWYRAVAPPGVDLTAFPQRYLEAQPHLAQWHKFGMEWKEHVAWLSPIFATVVVFVTVRYGARLRDMPAVRRTLQVLFTLAFLSGLVAAMLGGMLNKVAPNAFIF